LVLLLLVLLFNFCKNRFSVLGRISYLPSIAFFNGGHVGFDPSHALSNPF
jgi:hypothetical protein